MFTFETKKDNEAPLFAQAGSKYAAIHEALERISPDEWLVIKGFADIDELRRVQSGYRGGGSTRKWGKRGLNPRCRAYAQNGRLELWIKLVPIAAAS
jgi:hypothetical protein